jgi:hypothetical protein
MIQKIFLLIGISILFSIISCDKTDDNGSTDTRFSFKNNTIQNVELIVYNRNTQNTEVFLLEPNQVKTFQKICTDGAGNGICEWFTTENDLTFKFIADDNCLINYPKTTDSRMYDNFTTAMYNNSVNTLIYLIDDEEVAAATPCL